MRTEIRITNHESNPSHLEIFANQLNRNLYINKKRVYLEGFLNITGPHCEDEEVTIRLTYRIKNRNERVRSIGRIKQTISCDVQTYQTEQRFHPTSHPA